MGTDCSQTCPPSCHRAMSIASTAVAGLHRPWKTAFLSAQLLHTALKQRRLWPVAGKWDGGHCNVRCCRQPTNLPHQGEATHIHPIGSLAWQQWELGGCAKCAKSVKHLQHGTLCPLCTRLAEQTHSRRGTRFLTWVPIVHRSTDACQSPARS